jgi:spore coat protein JB
MEKRHALRRSEYALWRRREETMNNVGHNSGERKALFDAIGAVSFAMDELRLFLDTHPDSRDALALFNEYRDRRHQLVGQYTAQFGSLDAYYPNTDSGWNWNEGPMPWKTEAN